MYILIITLLITSAAWGQQNITIKPGDDVVKLINSVWEIDSTITFETGFYPVSPDPENPTVDLFNLPEGATVKGAGGGMDPTTCTIIDLQYSFSKAFDINNPFIIVEGLTVMRAIVHGVDLNETEAITFRDVWILKAFNALFNTDSGVDYVFENCVFGFGADELMKCNPNYEFGSGNGSTPGKQWPATAYLIISPGPNLAEEVIGNDNFPHGTTIRSYDISNGLNTSSDIVRMGGQYSSGTIVVDGKYLYGASPRRP